MYGSLVERKYQFDSSLIFFEKSWVVEENHVRAMPILNVHINFPFQMSDWTNKYRTRRDGKYCQFHQIWYTEHIVSNTISSVTLAFSSAFAKWSLYEWIRILFEWTIILNEKRAGYSYSFIRKWQMKITWHLNLN